MKDKSKARKAWSKWTKETILQYREATFGECNSKSNSPKGCHYLVTVKFKTDEMPKQNYGNKETEIFDALYKVVCNKAISRRYVDKKYRHVLPLAIAFLDSNNAKLAKEIDGALENPHVHSIWSCHQDNVESIAGTLKSYELIDILRKKYPVSAIDIKPMDDQYEKVSDYIMKLEFVEKKLDMGVTYSLMPMWRTK